jgi:flagellar motor protein MotB
MGRRVVSGLGIVAGAIVALAFVATSTGCASGQTKERLSVALAENADLRQQKSDLESQYATTAAEHDRALADLARKQQELALAQSQAQQNAEYGGRVAEMQRELAAAESKQRELYDRMNAIAKPQPGETLAVKSSPHLEAFRTDLKARLQRYGVNGVDVEVRTAQDGQQRVAVVLQNSFRAGSASMSYNTAAVKAVVGLGKLVSESYRGSRVSVEGHTDSDPIRKSKWDSNEALSLARAEEVKKLLRQAGVSESLVSAVGMGARQPVARGTTDRSKAQNRRVEIYIIPAN